MEPIKYTNVGIGIFYSFEESHLVVGGISKEKRFLLIKAIQLADVQPPDIRKLLGEHSTIPEIQTLYKEAYTHVPKIFTSKDKFLASAIEQYEPEEVDFEYEHKAELRSLDNLYKALRKTHNIFLLEQPIPEQIVQNNPKFIEAFKILLWGIGKNLYSDHDDNDNNYLGFDIFPIDDERARFYEVLSSY